MKRKQYYVALSETAAKRLYDLSETTFRKPSDVIERLLMNTPSNYQLRYVRKDPVYDEEVNVNDSGNTP